MIGSFTLGTVGTPKSEDIPRGEGIKWRGIVLLRCIKVIIDTISPAKKIVVDFARKNPFEFLVTREAEDKVVAVVGSKSQANQIGFWKIGDDLEDDFVGQVFERPDGRRCSLIGGEVRHCCCFCRKLSTDVTK